MSTSIKERLTIANYIKSNPTATNSEVMQDTGININVGGIRKWITQKGIDEYIAYVSELKAMESKRRAKTRKKVKTGEFTNQDGEKKNVARNKMVNAISNSGIKAGKLLTMPNEDWKIEALIDKYVSKIFKYEACENNKKVFPIMLSKVEEFGRSSECHYGDIGKQIIPMGADTYSHMILDYCGNLDTFQNEIIHAMMNKLVVDGGIIAITLSKVHNYSPKVGKVNKLRDKIAGFDVAMYDDTCKTTVYIKMFFEMMCSLTDFEVIESLEYMDKAPMMLTILRRKS